MAQYSNKDLMALPQTKDLWALSVYINLHPVQVAVPPLWLINYKKKKKKDMRFDWR